MGGEVSSEFAYTVQIPATPDFQTMMSSTPTVRPMDPGIATKAEQQFVSSTIFTGGFNSVTRGHVMEKMMETEATHPQLACARGTNCSVDGCDGKSLRDERAMTCFPVNVVSEFAETVTLMRSNLLGNALDARRISKAVMKAQGIQVFGLCLPLGLTIPRWSGGYRC